MKASDLLVKAFENEGIEYVFSIPEDPLMVPAIVLLLEETEATNKNVFQILDYKPQIH